MAKKISSEMTNPQSLRVLIVEDSEDDALLIIRDLKKGGYIPAYERVETATAMKKALQEKQWEIILCDYKLPKFNAPSAIAVLKEANIDIPLIIVSGTMGEETAVECMRLGAHDYIMKGNWSRLCPAIARELKEAEFRNRQKQAESQREAVLEELRQSEEKYRTIIETIQDGYIETGLNGKIIFMNDMISKHVGYSREELIGKTGRMFQDEANFKKVSQAFIQTYKTGRSTNSIEMNCIRKDGTKGIYELSLSLVRDAQGNPIGFRSISRDITERKQAEEAMRQNEEKYRNILENIEEGYYEVDIKGNITFFNDSMCRILGYPREELMGMNNRQIADEENAKKVFQAFKKVYDTGKHIKEFNWQLIGKDGTIRYIEQSASLQKDSSGKPIGFKGIIRDITERKLAESQREVALEAMRQSEEKYRTFIETIHDGYYEVDLTGKYTFINDVICQHLLYSKKELIGKDNRYYQTKENAKKAFQKFTEVLLTGNPVKAYEMEVIRKDGSIQISEVSISLIRDAEDKPIAFRGTSRDITGRKRMEEQLRQSEEKYRSILETIQEGYSEVDLAGNLTFFNDSLCRLIGYSKEELMGMNYRQYSDKEDTKRLFQMFNKIYNTGEPSKELDWQVIRKDGTRMYLQQSASLRKDSSGKPIGFIGIIHDITEHKQAEEKLRESEANYRQLYNCSPAAIYRIDFENGKFLTANDIFCEYLGCTQEEIISLSPYDILTEESKKLFVERVEKMALGIEVPTTVEFEIFAKEGKRMYLQLNINNIYDAEGHVVAADVVANDITERKKMEAALQKSEKYFKEITENSSDIIIITDKKGNIKYCSRSIERFTGYKPEELIGRNGLKLIHPDDVKRAASDYSKAIVAIDAAVPNEFRIVCKDGSERYFSGLGRNLLDNPAVAGFIINARDVTESKLVNAELQRTLDNLRKSFGTTIQVMVSAVEMRDPYTAGHQLRVADIARSIAQEMGLSQDQVDGIRLAGSIHDIGKLSIPAEILAKPTKLTDIEFSLIKEHSRIGYEMLKDMESPWPLAQIVYQHHERMNGSGYPRKLKGDEILIEARIMAVADVVEAMASHRPYRPGLGIEAALEEIEKNKGIFYDNVVADACVRLFREKNYKLP